MMRVVTVPNVTQATWPVKRGGSRRTARVTGRAEVTLQTDNPRTSAELEAVLSRRTSVVAAYQRAFALASRSAHVGLPAALVYGVCSALGGIAILGLADAAAAADRQTLQTWAQVTGGAAAFLLLYTAIQFGKRDRVSRASWFPSLLALPIALVAGALMVAGGAGANQLLVPALLGISWALAFSSIAGASAAIAWCRSGRIAMDDQPVSFGNVSSEVRRRTLEVSAPHGARVHAVTIGMQVLLPGIFYALQYAFTDMIAVLDPEKPALRRSGLLTFGMRSRLFRTFLPWWFVSTAISTVVAFAADGVLTNPGAWPASFMAPMLDPSSVQPSVLFAQEVIWAITSWILTLALLVLYVEREEQVRARAVQKGRSATGT